MTSSEAARKADSWEAQAMETLVQIYLRNGWDSGRRVQLECWFTCPDA